MQQLSTTKPTVAEVVKDTLRTRGPFGLYKGLDSMVYFATPKAAIRFSGFEAASTAMRGSDGTPMFGAATSFAAGLVAGAMEAIAVTTPQETIKIKLIDDQFKVDGSPPRFQGFFHGVRTIVAEEGFGGIYHGLSPTILKVGCSARPTTPPRPSRPPLGAASAAVAPSPSARVTRSIDVVCPPPSVAAGGLGAGDALRHFQRDPSRLPQDAARVGGERRLRRRRLGAPLPGHRRHQVAHAGARRAQARGSHANAHTRSHARARVSTPAVDCATLVAAVLFPLPELVSTLPACRAAGIRRRSTASARSSARRG